MLLVLAALTWITALTALLWGSWAVIVLSSLIVCIILVPQKYTGLHTSFKTLIVGVHIVTLLAVILAGHLRSNPTLDEAATSQTYASVIVEITGYCKAQQQTLQQRCPGRVWAEQQGSAKRATITMPNEHTAIIGKKYFAQAKVRHNEWHRNEHYSVTIQNILHTKDPSPLSTWFNTIRDGLTTSAASLPPPGGPLIPGMAIGQTTLVDDTLDQAMKTTSLSHLTAVSGSNFSMVVLSIMMGMSLIGIRPSIKYSIGFITLTLFFLLVTEEPSVVRAATMMILTITAQIAGRPGTAEQLLSITVLAVILFDPWKAISYGFALSAAATAGLIYLAGPLSTRLGKWMPKPIAVIIAIPITAQAACEPILILLDPYISGYGVLANLLSTPLAPVATSLGLIAGITLSLTPILPILAPVGYGLMWIAWLPSQLIGLIAETLEQSPGAKLSWTEGLPGFFGAALLLTLFTIWLKRPETLKKPWLRQLGTWSTLVTLLTASSLIFFNKPPWKDWNIALCDVGQGTAILLQSNQQHALIDTGPDPEALAACLNTLGVTELSLVIITHFDQDHIGGIPALMNVPVREVLYSAIDSSQEEYLRDNVNAIMIPARSGMTGTIGEYVWRVHWPTPDFPTFDTNQASVVTSFYGPIDFVSLGDVSAATQRAIYAIDRPPQTTAVAVAHHGSKDQEPALYQYLDAEIALFPVGKNSYGHPAAETLELVQQATVFRSDQDGLVLLRRQPSFEGKVRNVEVWTRG